MGAVIHKHYTGSGNWYAAIDTHDSSTGKRERNTYFLISVIGAPQTEDRTDQVSTPH